MIFILWNTLDGKEHYSSFGRHGMKDDEEIIEKAQNFYTELCQNSVLNKGNNKHEIEYINVVHGTILDVNEKKQVVISDVVFKFEDSPEI